jgi:hypothetical protein
MFGTQGQVVEEKQGGVSAFLAPGIHEVKIVGVEYIESRGGTPGIKLTFEGKPNGDNFNHPAGPQFKGSTAENTYWLSEKAWKYTQEKLILIADKLGVRTQLDAATGANAEEYTKAITPVFMGLAGRFKFAGQEIEGKIADDGTKKNNWFKAELAGYGFVEPLSVSADQSKLKFDENNKYDMKRLPEALVEDTTSAADDAFGGDSDDAPW